MVSALDYILRCHSTEFAEAIARLEGLCDALSATNLPLSIEMDSSLVARALDPSHLDRSIVGGVTNEFQYLKQTTFSEQGG